MLPKRPRCVALLLHGPRSPFSASPTHSLPCRREPLGGEVAQRDVALELATLDEACAGGAGVERDVGEGVARLISGARFEGVSTRDERGEKDRQTGTHVGLGDELVERVGAPLFVHPLRREQLARKLELSLCLSLLSLRPSGERRRPPRPGEELELVSRLGRLERERRDGDRDGDLARGRVGLALVVLVPDADDVLGRGGREGLAEGDCGGEGEGGGVRRVERARVSEWSGVEYEGPECATDRVRGTGGARGGGSGGSGAACRA